MGTSSIDKIQAHRAQGEIGVTGTIVASRRGPRDPIGPMADPEISRFPRKERHARVLDHARLAGRSR